MEDLNTKSLAQNRAEEIGNDVWGKFVIPPFYQKLDLQETKKPRIIIGGRGCGKTMLLRYLCFDTVFSQHKAFITETDFKNIGIYWKINTQLSGLMKARSIENDVWLNALQHYSVLILSTEIIRFLQTVAQRRFQKKPIILQPVNLQFAVDYLRSDIRDVNSLDLKLKTLLREFNLWLSNVHQYDRPVFLPKEFLDEFVSQIKTSNEIFVESNFFVYIDEFENLEPFQKPLINTWLKHSTYPLIFNIAMKRGLEIRDTLGDEKIVNIHDYRIYDLEYFLSDDSVYKLFAAEILFLRLTESDNQNESRRKYKEALLNPSSLMKRTRKAYQDVLMEFANSIFPSLSYKEIASLIFTDNSLHNIFKEVLEKAEINSEYGFKKIMNNAYPEANLVTPFLLKRRKTKKEAEIVILEYQKLIDGKKSKYNAPTDFIKNNLVASILYIYEGSQTVCPIFAGFETFCKLSHGNIRYFIELCHKSLDNSQEKDPISLSKTFLVKAQAEAARNASYYFLNEIRKLGKRGNALYLFAYRLGAIFKLASKNPLLSEPEINHFSIKDYKEGSNEEIDEFLIEAVKWSVLYKSKSTKTKSQNYVEDFDYVLNPIYSPFFNISFRKIRKIEIDKNQFLLLMKGEEEHYRHLYRGYKKRWNLEQSSSTLNLFEDI